MTETPKPVERDLEQFKKLAAEGHERFVTARTAEAESNEPLAAALQQAGFDFERFTLKQASEAHEDAKRHRTTSENDGRS